MFLAYLQLLFFVSLTAAQIHVFNFNVTYVDANPDGLKERRVIGINNQWPLPTINVTKGDQVLLYLTNKLPDQNTSLHFHGLFQNGSNIMDGPQMVTQCPIVPGETLLYNFTVSDQIGTYWYHSHTGSQYSDGLRGAFIINDIEPLPFHYDEDVVIPLSDWYHKEAPELMKGFLSRYNPTGAEPIPQSVLFQETNNATISVKPNSTYLLRFINMGMFVSQYIYLEDHEFTIVEIDGVLVEPKKTEALHISVGQRTSVLLRTKENSEKNYAFMQVIDEEMLDFNPPDLRIYYTNTLSYGDWNSKIKSYIKDVNDLAVYDDFNLKTIDEIELFDDYDYQINVDFVMENLGDGINYAFFNNISYTPPKVPTLFSVLSSPSEELLVNSKVYGSNTNSFVLQKDEIVEIVLNNKDPGKHPFHLHGHNFQVISRSEEGDDDFPIIYNESNPEHTQFPRYPMTRDTVLVNKNGFVVIRFKADNPGVWFFHCHVDWHLEQGLALVLIESPLELQKKQSVIPTDHLRICDSANINTRGNAAGNFDDWLDLAGENLQPDALPEGFTFKGYVALLISTFMGLFGVYTIFGYGLETVKPEDEERISKNLVQILKDNNCVEPEFQLQHSNPQNEDEPDDINERTLLSSDH